MTGIANHQKPANEKCYNSFSCILSVVIIVFVVASIGWDSFVSKPEIRRSIDEIRLEVKDIHQKIDKQYQMDTLAIRQTQSILPQNKSE